MWALHKSTNLFLLSWYNDMMDMVESFVSDQSGQEAASFKRSTGLARDPVLFSFF